MAKDFESQFQREMEKEYQRREERVERSLHEGRVPKVWYYRIGTERFLDRGRETNVSPVRALQAGGELNAPDNPGRSHTK